MFVRDIDKDIFPMYIDCDTYVDRNEYVFVVSYSMYYRNIKCRFLTEKIYRNDIKNLYDFLNVISGEKMKKHLIQNYDKELIRKFGL